MYAALPTALAAVAIALTVKLETTGIALTYFVEAVVGVEPSVM